MISLMIVCILQS